MVEITDENFNQYFFDVRQHSPKPGQIMVCYSAMADFKTGPEKRQMIDLLSKPGKGVPASQVMRKLLLACEEDSVRVPKMIIEDLLSGMTPKQVERKAYRYKLEMFFYTMPEYVPNDPHWTSISLLHLDDYLKTRDADKPKFIPFDGSMEPKPYPGICE